MVNFLQPKFSEQNNPSYYFKEITCNKLDIEHSTERLLKHKTIDGPNSFQVMVFTPNSETFKASPRICTCELCISDDGSCSFFEEFQLSVQSLNKVFLRDNFLPEDI